MIKRVKQSDHPLPISVARRRLFELVEEVLSGRTDRVALSHRGHAERVVIVRADVFAKLEADLAELRGRTEPEPRTLLGVATLHGPVDEAVAEVRARQHALAEAKGRDIVGARGGGRGSA